MSTHPDIQLAGEIARYYADPLGFVLLAYPWGEKGPLRDYDGPDTWQREALIELGRKVEARGFDGLRAVEPIREATASGHGIGKSTFVAWIVNWIMSTRADSQGTVTANTFTQLQTKTWASICKWTKLCITAHWFEITGSKIYRKGKPESWFCAAATCKEENSEAFAGQHAANSTSYYIFDEASNIPDEIWNVAEGGLTDGEPMFFAFGNPTRRDGKFHRVTYGSERGTWASRSIDSRTSRFTNKALIDEWIKAYGEDSDFVRVRVRGLPPNASDLQFIDYLRVQAAQKRPAVSLDDDPLVVGIDVARGGSDDCRIVFRKGLDARSIRSIKIPGELVRDSMIFVSKVADVLSNTFGGQRVTKAFLDETGVGGAVGDRIRQLGFRNCIGVQFGGESPDHRYANMRGYMWGRMRDWLERGAIPEDTELEIDITGPGYHFDKRDRYVLESKEDMKKRGLDSPDFGDALALTFAQSVAPLRVEPRKVRDRFDPRTWERNTEGMEYAWMG